MMVPFVVMETAGRGRGKGRNGMQNSACHILSLICPCNFQVELSIIRQISGL